MKTDDTPAPRRPSSAWMSYWLIAAGLYNLAWGAAVVAAPNLLFDMLGMDRPRYPGIWQCVGMIVGVYGMGYLIAAIDPLRHWPIVLVGLLGKIFGPIGFLFAALRGELPPVFGLMILSNDLLWWIPFVLILRAAYFRFVNESEAESIPFARAMDEYRDQLGRTLREISSEHPTLLVFLRHAGCTFCRETLAALRRDRQRIESDGVGLALVHMSSDADARSLFATYQLDDAPRFSDRERKLYRAFELRRGRLGQLLGPSVWWRGARAFFSGHAVGRLDGDGFQMPGAFLVHHGKIVNAFRPRTAADAPDYCRLAASGSSGA